MNILQVSTLDICGGAERIAWTLFKKFQERGHGSWMAVGAKKSNDANVLVIQNSRWRPLWERLWIAVGIALLPTSITFRGAARLRTLIQSWPGQPGRIIKNALGHEDFYFPGTRHILELPPRRPSILHCHNLHRDYFDLHALPWLSKEIPTVITLHDAWLLSGHCAHSFDCERWKKGCGKCPDLTIYPAIRGDATSYNWRLKRDIFSRSRFYVATPCRWLMNKVKQSILASSIEEARVIPNGVDLTIFHPDDKQKLREILGIPQEARVLLFTANGIRENIWKDYKTLQTAVEIVAERLPTKKIIFIALGENAHIEQIGKAEVHFIPYQPEPKGIARYYQASDIYIHGARVDTFPNTVLEALACSTPVVATAVGGIPEQIEDGITGFLTPPGNSDAMAAQVIELLEDEELRKRISDQAAENAKKRFDIKRMADDYLGWYQEILNYGKKYENPNSKLHSK